MRLTVLGCYGPFPAAGKACSGYLLESGEQSLLIECGSGVLANLTRFAAPEKLCGVVVSHLHFDHASDLGVLRYRLEFAKASLPVLAPKTPAENHAALLGGAAFTVTDAAVGVEYAFGPFRARVYPAVHPVEAYSLSVTDGEKTLFYTGDTGWHDALSDYARGADLLLADTCFWASREGQRNIHLTVPEAGEIARKAGVKRLLCSHLYGGIPDGEPPLPDGLCPFENAETARMLCTYEL